VLTDHKRITAQHHPKRANAGWTERWRSTVSSPSRGRSWKRQ